MIDYDVLATGSKGNCVIINKEIAIDMGVPFKALRDCYKNLRLVLLTHRHQDHFNPATIKRLAAERPTLRWGVPEWLVPPLVECGVNKRNIDVYPPNMTYVYMRGIMLKMEPTAHNVPNCAWHIFNEGRVFYATDTNTLDGIEANNYDLYMVEANYSEAEIIERIRAKQEAGEYCHEWDVLKNHLSKEKAENWLYQNMGPNSRYVFLHQHEEREAIICQTEL